MAPLRRDLHALTGAYALDALDGAERDRFARHLGRCRPCAAEVRGLREVATSLAFAAAAEPPPALRARVLAAAARTRQLPPEAGRHVRPRAARGWMPWLAGAVAAAAVAAAAVLGAVQANTSAQLSQARAASQAIAAVLAAPDARLLATRTTAGGHATVVVAAGRRELIVTTTGLPSLAADRVYQLWLIGTRRTVSAGLLPPGSPGRTAPVLASGLVAGDKLGLTVEPAPGTARPTTKPIMVLLLPV
ncbi:MAG: anti-sigma factor [Streptosporangiaceae bacterium]|nr:anti-sigma factor [Streptosporangiaceae bacterium]